MKLRPKRNPRTSIPHRYTLWNPWTANPFSKRRVHSKYKTFNIKMSLSQARKFLLSSSLSSNSDRDQSRGIGSRIQTFWDWSHTTNLQRRPLSISVWVKSSRCMTNTNSKIRKARLQTQEAFCHTVIGWRNKTARKAPEPASITTNVTKSLPVQIS